MSKSKIILASLGVVAGLGTAALPLASFATGPNVSGNVQLAVEVLPAISMTITGNNDGNTLYGTAGDNGAVDHFDNNPDGVIPASDPEASYVEPISGTVDGNETTTAEQASILASSSYTSILPNAKFDGNANNGFGSTVTVYTNNSAGYTLAIKDADSDLKLKNANNDEIAAGTTISAGTSNWAYQLQKDDGAAVASPAYAAITASDVTIVTRGTETSGGSENFIGYGVSTASDQATGVYTDTIVYTATAQ